MEVSQNNKESLYPLKPLWSFLNYLLKPPLKTFKPPEKGKQREVTEAYEYNDRVTMLDAKEALQSDRT